MDSNILLSKIVANPTDSSWAQVYSTLNLYVALSIKIKAEDKPDDEASEATPKEEAEKADEANEPKVKKSDKKEDKTIAADGKELLERIQREYFSQDVKSLENIKKSVDEAITEAGDPKNISIVLANITDDILYIVVLGAKVILKRNNKVATIADGQVGVVEAYSGKIAADDTIILETSGFAEKIPVEKLSETLDHLDVSEISESLAPLVHADPAGTEAAIILQYKKIDAIPTAPAEEDTISTPEASDETQQADTMPASVPTWEKNAEKHDEDEANDPISHLADSGSAHKPESKMAIPKVALGDKKKIIIIVIILLIILFVGSIFVEKGRKESAQQNQILNDILGPAQKKFDEANALVNLNKGLALDEFNDLKTSLENDASKLPSGSDARKKFDDFLKKVNDKINELGQGATLAGQKVVFENASQVSYRDDTLVVINSDGKISILDENGKSTKDIDTKNKSISALTSNENDVFAAGNNGITNSSKDGDTKTAVKDPGTIVSLDTFGANLYALNTTDKTVDKYPTGTFAKSSYFTEDVSLDNPSSMTIDASIWILDGGKIRKFTKGKEESFSVSGLTKDISTGSMITTGIDYNNIYVLDPANRRIISISKSGEIDNQYVSKDLSQATSIAVDEPNKKIYVVISGKLNSFDL